ncbi:endonuclease domain-containing protein [Geodermatophilus sp. SYSU D00815]
MAHGDYTRSSRTPSGFGSQCTACKSALDSAGYIYRTYRLTRAEIADLRAAKGNRCAICGEPDPLHLDHDHESGLTRQLPCQRCNWGLGLLRGRSCRPAGRGGPRRAAPRAVSGRGRAARLGCRGGGRRGCAPACAGTASRTCGTSSRRAEQPPPRVRPRRTAAPSGRR